MRISDVHLGLFMLEREALGLVRLRFYRRATMGPGAVRKSLQILRAVRARRLKPGALENLREGWYQNTVLWSGSGGVGGSERTHITRSDAIQNWLLWEAYTGKVWSGA